MRAPAKRYLRSLDLVDVPRTEPECVAALVDSHKRQRELLQRENPLVRRPWFGRLLWKLFSRWL